MPHTRSDDALDKAIDRFQTVKQIYRDKAKDKLTQGWLKNIKVELESRWKALEGEMEYAPTLFKDDEDTLQEYRKLFHKTQNEYFDIIGEVIDYLDPFIVSNKIPQQQQQNIIESAPVSTPKVRLPPLSIEKFTGEYNKWRSFRDLFSSIIKHNLTLTPVEKLYYLSSYCEGRPKEIVLKYPLESASFDAAWKALIAEYENPRVLVTAQLKKLFACQIVKSESASALRELQNTFNDSINSLNNLEINTTHWDPILVYMATQRLPTLSHTLWESSLDATSDLPTWETLNTFLNQRFRTLEAIDTKRTDIHLHSSQYKDKRVTPFKSYQSSSHNVCSICSKSPHSITQCELFKSWSPTSRFDYIKQNKLCINCLGFHKFQHCSSKGVCRHCSRKHHSLLHFQTTNQSSVHQTCSNAKTNTKSNKSRSLVIQKSEPLDSNQLSNPPISSPTINSIACFAQQGNKVLLATALVNIVHMGGIYTARALIDQGSETSFMTQSLAQLLKVKLAPCSASISGVGIANAIHASKYASLKLRSQYLPSTEITVQAIVLKKLVHSLPSHSVPTDIISQFSKLQLADPKYFKPESIDLLLGSDVYSQIIRSGFYSIPGFVGQETIFGYIVSGSWNEPNKLSNSISTKFSCNLTLEKTIHRFWEIEEPPTVSDPSSDAQYCEEHFETTHYRRPDGRFVVELPFVQEYPDKNFLAPSRSVALSRLQSLKRSFARNTHLKQSYDAVIKEYVTLNHITTQSSTELFDSNQSKEIICNSYYLPHHGVIKEHSLTTKLRVVFDASCKSSNGVSLNDILYAGPPLQSQILDVLNNIRIYPLLFNCDIKMMYRQILVSDKHTNFQRILYLDDNDNPIDYKLLTVTFGVSCSPYLAMRCLRQLALTGKDKFPLASNILLSLTYVDDIFGGFYDQQTALAARQQLTLLLSTAGFELHKWVANNSALLDGIPLDYQSAQMSDNSSSLLKTLGILFDQQKDLFTFATPELKIKYPLTKRKVFSSISKIFDPAGWLSPVFITAKILMQDIWSDNVDWDEPISPIRTSTWETFIASLDHLPSIAIPRWFNTEPTAKLEIHGFCDASIKAYAACVYLRVIKNNQIFSSLMLSKTKVAPLKTESLPRLELCGALLLSKLFNYIQKSWQLKAATYYAWCDSTIVLAWLAKPSYMWKTFVSNRVTKIIRNCPEAKWSHIISKQNPADLASRGASPQDLIKNKMWFYGPDFLQESGMPEKADILVGTDLELKTIKVCHSIEESNVNILLLRFSKFTKAIRVLAYVHRFSEAARKRSRPYTSHNISCEEFEKIKLLIIQLVQKVYYFEEIVALKNNNIIPSNSKLKSLNPMLDQYETLRVNGRLSNLTIPAVDKFPLIIPNQSHLATLITNHYHLQNLHASQRLMESLIRRSYWIPRLAQLVKRTIHLCKICYVEKRKIMSQIMAPLPLDRITPSTVFSNVGLDFGGPISLKLYEGRCNKTTKGYICLFVCFATKAIHLEAVSSLSTRAFLDAFDRFVARRGLCQRIYCDNGTNFVGAKNILDREAHLAIKNATEEARKIYASRRVDFILNCPVAPHMAGLAEAGIKSVKYHLKRTIANVNLCFEQLATVLCKIEACLNSRPLCALNGDPQNLEPLTPGHFIRGDALLAPLDSSLNISETSKPFKLLRNLEQLKVLFWNRWKNEYLHTLQQRYKWQTPANDIQINDLVVLIDKNSPPQSWVTGRIVQLFPSSRDGHIRIVQLKTKFGTFKRPISSLVLLPKSDQ